MREGGGEMRPNTSTRSINDASRETSSNLPLDLIDEKYMSSCSYRTYSSSLPILPIGGSS